MPTDHAMKIDEGGVPVYELSRRVSRLEDAQHEIVKRQYALENELTAMNKDISYIRETQDKQTQGINRILWAIILAVVAAATTFVLDGGLVSIAQ